MATEFSWSFPTLDVVYNVEGYSNVVSVVHWVYSGVNGKATETIPGFTALPLPQGAFVDFSDLTPEIVTGWVTSILGEEKIAEMQAELEARIAAFLSPKGGSEPPPWQ